jgi:S1-C subfamily serine protease
MEFLSQQGVPFQEKDVSRDHAAAMEMVRRSGQRGVPVITVDDDVIVGFDRRRLEQLIARGGARPSRTAGARPRLGAAVADADEVAARRGAVDGASGAYAGRVAADSAAARAGLQAGDTIVALNGNPIATAADVERFMAGARAGQPIEIQFVRDGRRLSGRARL